MNPEQVQETQQENPAEKLYKTLCLATLGVIFLVFLERGLNLVYAAFPIVIGLWGISSRWTTPIPLLFLVAILPGVQDEYLYVRSRLRLSDILLCGAVLAYLIGYYRLQSMSSSILPQDPRRRTGKPRWEVGILFFPLRYRAAIMRRPRAADTVHPREMLMLLLSLPAFVGLGFFCWHLLPVQWGNPGVEAAAWRAIFLAWIVAVSLFTAAGFLDYWQRRTMTAEEAAMLLQDALWKETRREQRRLNGWLAWNRLRQRRKEKP